MLTYGILSAAVLRGVMIAAGAELLENFRGVLLLFAGVLLYSSWKLLAGGDEEEGDDLTDNWIVTTCRCPPPPPSPGGPHARGGPLTSCRVFHTPLTRLGVGQSRGTAIRRNFTLRR